MSRRKVKRRPPPPGRKTVARRARRMHAVRNVAIDMLADENPDLLRSVLTDSLREWRLLAAYLLPGRTITEVDAAALARLHLIASPAFPPS